MLEAIFALSYKLKTCYITIITQNNAAYMRSMRFLTVSMCTLTLNRNESKRSSFINALNHINIL